LFYKKEINIQFRDIYFFCFFLFSILKVLCMLGHLKRIVMKVIGHRGAPHEGEENSLAAFEAAMNGGADGIECDVRFFEGELVLSHDEPRGRPCRVSELLELTKEWSGVINWEVKEDSSCFLVARLIEMLPRDRLNKTVISSFLWEPLIWLKDRAPEWQRALLLEEEHSWAEAFRATKVPQVHPEVHCLQGMWARWGLIVWPWVPLRGKEDTPQQRERLWTSLAGLTFEGLCTNWPREYQLWKK
jgi:glycerophosphoryl diester phosphodiesterase